MSEPRSLEVVSGRLLAGRYRLGRRIAAGGMALVWEGTDEVLARSVAVKILHPHLSADPDFIRRFRREAVAMARLTHPGIVAVYDVFTDGDAEAIVMELVVGTTLRRVLEERSWLEPGEAIRIAVEIADALTAAHQAGVVHRDIKPSNVLLSEDGRVRVADFGIAQAGGDVTSSGAAVGTAKYLAPEQVSGGPLDARTDVYALGVVLYEALCGLAPFVADTEAATALARLHRDPRPLRGVSPAIPVAVEAVVGRAMARDPAQRYASASDLRAALLAASRVDPNAPSASPQGGDATAEIGPADMPPVHNLPPIRGRWRRRTVGAVVGLVAVVAAAVGGSWLHDHSPSSGPGSGAGGAIAALRIARVQAFDPFGQGDGGEHDDQAPLTIDGNANTAWSTEGYNQRDFGTKPGVGLIMVLDRSARLSTLQITSPTNGWSVEIYVADQPQSTKDLWGTPAATRQHLTAGTASIDLAGRSGAAVLLWITDLGDEPAPTHARIAELRLQGT